MGKKKDKKIKGAEKTLLKTEKNSDKKAKKDLRAKGEEDIETIISQFEEQDRKRQQIVEEKCLQPSPRCNMSLVPHPEKDVLIMFGGEFFNGAKTFMYNDLFYYNIRTNEWTLVKAPNAPAPRCSHQAVIFHQSGGQMWLFGGEFASPTQSQFYHYRDLWLFNLKDQTWQKINANGGPSSRSGHRMVSCRKMIFIFGGFHDNVRDYKYFNDLYAFHVETYHWLKLDITGIPPSPRSGCVIAVTQDNNHIIIYGGYSKQHVKKEVDKGQMHTDMFMLSIDTKTKSESVVDTRWKWVSVKQLGNKPSPRCSSSMVVMSNNRAVLFGGVFDEEEDEESVKGTFYNDMYCLELDKGRWHEMSLRKKKEENELRKRRRRDKPLQDDASVTNESNLIDEEADEESSSDIDEEVKKMKVSEDPNCAAAAAMEEKEILEDNESSNVTFDDGIFTVRLSSTSNRQNEGMTNVNSGSCDADVFTPSPRMNPVLSVKHGTLFLYGGIYEDGDRQVTLSDFYSIDIHKLNEWKTIISQDTSKMEWQDSESSSSSEDEETGSGKQEATGGKALRLEDRENDDDDDDDSSSSHSDDEEEEECIYDEAVVALPPAIDPLEGSGIYFDRTKDFWIKAAAADIAKNESTDTSAKHLKKAASNMAKEFWKKEKSTQKS